MREEIYAVAAAMTSPAEQEKELLALLCQTEARKLEKALGKRTEECREAFLCAAAFLSAAALLESRSGGNTESFAVGDVSIKSSGSSDGAKRLREQAKRLLEGCGLAVDGFAFLGVRG